VVGLSTISLVTKHFIPSLRDIFRISFYRPPTYISGERKEIPFKEDTTMARYHGNETVNPGFYWNPNKWEVTTIEKKGATLPGGEEVIYHRIPLPLVLLLGPIMGAAYVIFLPLIGFGLFFGFLGKKALAGVNRATAKVTEPVKQER
jgi:hypothetical protein